jgi:hypothetical protein
MCCAEMVVSGIYFGMCLKGFEAHENVLDASVCGVA